MSIRRGLSRRSGFQCQIGQQFFQRGFANSLDLQQLFQTVEATHCVPIFNDCLGLYRANPVELQYKLDREEKEERKK